MQCCKISETNDIHIKHLVENHNMCEIEIASENFMKNFIEEPKKTKFKCEKWNQSFRYLPSLKAHTKNVHVDKALGLCKLCGTSEMLKMILGSALKINISLWEKEKIGQVLWAIPVNPVTGMPLMMNLFVQEYLHRAWIGK